MKTAAPVAAIDMDPMAPYMDLKDAALAVDALRSRLKPGEQFVLAYRSCDRAQCEVLAARLRARAAEFDTRRERCAECGFRHPAGEPCSDPTR